MNHRSDTCKRQVTSRTATAIAASLLCSAVALCPNHPARRRTRSHLLNPGPRHRQQTRTPVCTPDTGFNARIGKLHELLCRPNRDVLMDAVRAGQQEVWFYQFDWDQQPPPFDDIYGAAHGFDVPFMFGNFEPSLFAAIMNTGANRPGRLALSKAMMRSVGSFAWHGDPNHAELGVRWPAWPDMLRFDACASAPAISVHARPEENKS